MIELEFHLTREAPWSLRGASCGLPDVPRGASGLAPGSLVVVQIHKFGPTLSSNCPTRTSGGRALEL